MRLLVTFSVLIMCLNLNAQKEKYFLSKWHETPSESSGNSALDFISTRNGEVLYSLSNDDVNLYVDVMITESIQQNKVLQMGMTVWINQDGKSRKITGIRYPVGAQYSREQGRQREMQNPLVKVSPLAQANIIELVGFKGVQPTRFPSANTDNMRGSLKYDKDGNLICSLTIPIAKLPMDKAVKIPAGMLMTMAVEYGAPPTVEASSPMSSPSGGMSRSGGSRSGGGSRGGAPGGVAQGGGTAPQNAPKPVIYWMKNIKLAERK